MIHKLGQYRLNTTQMPVLVAGTRHNPLEPTEKATAALVELLKLAAANAVEQSYSSGIVGHEGMPDQLQVHVNSADLIACMSAEIITLANSRNGIIQAVRQRRNGGNTL